MFWLLILKAAWLIRREKKGQRNAEAARKMFRRRRHGGWRAAKVGMELSAERWRELGLSVFTEPRPENRWKQWSDAAVSTSRAASSLSGNDPPPLALSFSLLSHGKLFSLRHKGGSSHLPGVTVTSISKFPHLLSVWEHNMGLFFLIILNNHELEHANRRLRPLRPSHPHLQHLQGLHHSPQDVPPMTPRLSNLINDRNMQMKTKRVGGGGQERERIKDQGSRGETNQAAVIAFLQASESNRDGATSLDGFENVHRQTFSWIRSIRTEIVLRWKCLRARRFAFPSHFTHSFF